MPGLVRNPGDPLLSALGAVAFTLYALGWGSLRRRGVVPEDAPNVIPGPPLQPRARPIRIAPFVFGLILVSALLPVFLAFRVVEAERGLFAHAVAILAAILTITVGARVATGLGQRRALPASAERLNAAAVPLALLGATLRAGFSVVGRALEGSNFGLPRGHAAALEPWHDEQSSRRAEHLARSRGEPRVCGWGGCAR